MPTSAQQSFDCSQSASHQQPWGARVPQLSPGARQPQSCPQFSSLSSSPHTPSPHGLAPSSHRLQSPNPKPHLDVFHQLHASVQEPQSVAQL